MFQVFVPLLFITFELTNIVRTELPMAMKLARERSLQYHTYQEFEMNDDIFHSLWSRGETMVITGLLKKMKIEWTPKYFVKHYGSQKCVITDCDTNEEHHSTVAQFFRCFGRYSHRQPGVYKLKDWPPKADFKAEFPALFEDFHGAVPAPNYTRRDGFYNIASYFPTNAVAPDMGPKMYCAFASAEDRKGSTRLHMDMVCPNIFLLVLANL